MYAEISWLLERLRRIFAPLLAFRTWFLNKIMTKDDAWREMELEDKVKEFWAKDGAKQKIAIAVIAAIAGAIAGAFIVWLLS